MNTLILFCSFLPLTAPLYSDQDFIRTVISKQSNKNLYRSKQPVVVVIKEEVPKFFDAREIWPFCDSLRTVRNHKMCGAGWAFAAVSTMSDRLCIQTKKNFEFSPQELVSCCEKCGGCDVGNASEAWKFWMESGIVSGGDYDGSFQGCQPYSSDSARFGEAPTCEKQCQSGHNTTYIADKSFGASFYVIEGGAQQIQLEIFKHGPVQAGLELYEDFFTYRKGVYRRKKTSRYVGYTYVKILGWGKERDTPFWLGVTSWGSDFGFFKILRGRNEAGIEGNVVAGLPRVNRPQRQSVVENRAFKKRGCLLLFIFCIARFWI